MADIHSPANDGRPVDATVKAPYKPPMLTVFGNVSSITRSGARSFINDGSSSSCPTGSGSNMDCMLTGSERAIKSDIVRIGDHPAGFGLYLFHYKPAYQDRFGHGRQFGVMVEEVVEIMPEAVSLGEDGLRRVNYAALGIRRSMAGAEDIGVPRAGGHC